jgi:DnaK suppressor protein
MNPKKGAAGDSSSSTLEEIQEHYPEFLQILKERGEEIAGRAREEKARLDEQVLQGPGDDADISAVDTSADYFLNLANTHQRELGEIRKAMERLQTGVYGVCESCEFPIALNRLRNLPFARLCIDCQSVIEGTRLNRRIQNIPKL